MKITRDEFRADPGAAVRLAIDTQEVVEIYSGGEVVAAVSVPRDRLGLPDAAADVATKYGMIGGEHHKQWVIDQMLRMMLGDKDYDAWVKHMNSFEDHPAWDVGVAP